MNYIEEVLARQSALLRALTYTARREAAQAGREGERAPSPVQELWELAELPESESGELTLTAEMAAEGTHGAREAAPGQPETAAAAMAGEEDRLGVRTVLTWETEPAETARELSRRCQRDARRYDGAFPLYE